MKTQFVELDEFIWPRGIECRSQGVETYPHVFVMGSVRDGESEVKVGKLLGKVGPVRARMDIEGQGGS